MISLNTLLLLSIYSAPVFTSELQSAYACEGSTLQIKCAPQGVINVIWENYGRLSKDICNKGPISNWNCVAKNTSDIVKNKCSNKPSCNVPALNSVFGDPCSGTENYLEVAYKCISKTTPLKHTITCEESIMNIRCEPGYMIDVMRVNYGRLTQTVCNFNGRAPIHNLNCLSRHSYDIVDNKCSSQQSCTLQVSSSVFGDPCVGTFKYIDVVYQCVLRPKPSKQSQIPSLDLESNKYDTYVALQWHTKSNHLNVVQSKCIVEPATKHNVACESSTLSMNCATGYEIIVLRANYGRLSQTICNPDGNAHILYNNCSSARTKNVVSHFCFGKQQCHIPATNKVFGDPCVGTSKYLNVDYQCIPKVTPRPTQKPATKHAVACESSTLSINCESGYKINVLSANYGRLSQTVCNPNGQAPNRHNICSSTRSSNVVSNYCLGKQKCNIPATNKVFGDPCEGTSKYLEIDYICIPSNNPQQPQ